MKRNRLNSIIWGLAPLIITYALGGGALAMDVSQCDTTLTKDTYSSTSYSAVDYRLATLVTQGQWEDSSHNGGANAVIYGIPIGTSYNDYKKNVQQSLNARNESLTTSEARQLAIQQLGDNGTTAYLACIKGITRPSGLTLWIGKETPTEVTVYALNTPPTRPVLLPALVKIEGATPSPGHTFPIILYPNSETILVVKRPSTPQILTVRGLGSGDSVELDPPASLPAPAPQYKLDIDDVDDRFYCHLNDNDNIIFDVGFGGHQSWNISQYLSPGSNILQCVAVDIHPDSDGNPCWHYHYSVTKNGIVNPKFIDHESGHQCGRGTQPPTGLAPEYIPY